MACVHGVSLWTLHGNPFTSYPHSNQFLTRKPDHTGRNYTQWTRVMDAESTGEGRIVHLRNISQHKTNKSDWQEYFRNNPGCRDHLLLLRVVYDQVIKINSKCVVTFIDFATRYKQSPTSIITFHREGGRTKEPRSPTYENSLHCRFTHLTVSMNRWIGKCTYSG